MIKSTISLSLIAALDRQGAIGRNNHLPWHLPDDLKRFKALTLGKPVLMGRKTAQSLGRALPGRQNLVLTSANQPPFSGMQAVASLEQALALINDADTQELCVIGGAQIYALTLPYAQNLYLTHVDTQVEEADTWFPEVNFKLWQATQNIDHPADKQHAFSFSFVDYRRVKN